MIQNLQRIIGHYHHGGDKWQNTDRLQLTTRGDPRRISTPPRYLYCILTPSLSSAQNSAGIQTLLDAEREAQKIVQQAREYRTKRIRDAKSEAQKEIEEYRTQKEQEFKKFEAEHSSGYKKAEEDANKEAEVKLQEIKEAGNSKGAKVVEDLINALTDVKPEASEKILSQA
ncbi:vacuolar ATP synthase subunit G [Aspergillus bombycis]|uniref:V-type proton ATPase subunit G n=1 Tax=Aspergillus bombycis TaxID=109264 RepID=A0A1F7ZUW3_9EURO|nr:vacuolar ATP synthase subunit G [Aspergillus bombycis]OGM43242.1 vacuolar ATP synthase subunit G [Aspergillus bombycis]